MTTTTRRRRRSVNARGRSIGFSRVRFAGVRRAMFARASAIVSSEGFDRSIGSRIDRIAPRGGCATNERAWILFYHGVFSDIWCILKTLFTRLCWFWMFFSDGSRVDDFVFARSIQKDLEDFVFAFVFPYERAYSGAVSLRAATNQTMHCFVFTRHVAPSSAPRLRPPPPPFSSPAVRRTPIASVSPSRTARAKLRASTNNRSTTRARLCACKRMARVT